MDREIAAHVNVIAGVVLGTALTNDDVACFSNLTAEELHAKALTVTVAAVIGTTYTFLVCHGILFMALTTLIVSGLIIHASR